MLFQIIISGLVIGSVYGLIALGYSLIYKSSGLMSFVQGDMLTFGAFLGYTFYGVLGIPFFISFFMVIFLMFLLGFGIEKGVIHRLVAKGVNPIYTVLATIAISYIIQNGSMVLFGSDIKYFPPVTSVKSIRLLGLSVQTEAALCIIASIIFMILFNFFMNKTSHGTAMRAATMDPHGGQGLRNRRGLHHRAFLGHRLRYRGLRRDADRAGIRRVYHGGRGDRPQGLQQRRDGRLRKHAGSHRGRRASGVDRDLSVRLRILGA